MNNDTSSNRRLPNVEGKTIVAHTEQGYYTDVLSSRHHIISDEPNDLGGTDEGMTPFELLKAALAACTSITVRMYADRKKWGLESIDTYVDLSTVSNDEGEKVQHFRIEIALYGDLDDAQRQKLLDISKRCPVHRALAGSMSFENVLR